MDAVKSSDSRDQKLIHLMQRYELSVKRMCCAIVQDAALAEEEAAIQDLQGKRLAIEPSFRALTRQTLLLKSRKQLEACARTKEEAHALSLKMAALREEELDHRDVRDQLLERKKELQG